MKNCELRMGIEWQSEESDKSIDNNESWWKEGTTAEHQRFVQSEGNAGAINQNDFK